MPGTHAVSLKGTEHPENPKVPLFRSRIPLLPLLLCPYGRELLKPPLKLGRKVVPQLQLVFEPQHRRVPAKQVRYLALAHFAPGRHGEGRVLAGEDG